jgi:hypothetical protein
MNRKLLKIATTLLVISTLVFGAVSAYATVKDSYNPINKYEKIEKTNDGIEKYKQSVKEQYNQLKIANVSDVMVTITFDKALSMEELERYVIKHNIKPVQIQARSLQGDGTRVTTMSKTTKGYKQTDTIIQQELQKLNLTFVGYVSMYALVNSCDIDSIQNDRNTYLDPFSIKRTLHS